MELNRIWSIGKENYIRLYPNPGFSFKIGKKKYKWSKHYGWKLSGTVR